MTYTIWHNGQFKSETDPLLSIDTRLRYGDGVFDTMLAVDGIPIHAELHIGRLAEHAETIGMESIELLELMDVIPDLLVRNHLHQEQAVINTYIIRKDARQGLLPAVPEDPDVIIRTRKLLPNIEPITAIISSVRRNEGSPLSRIKSMSYGDNLLARMEAEDKNANEALMLNNAGNPACFTIGNLFIKKDGGLYTPPLSDGAMNGVIRGLLIERHGAQEKSLKIDDLNTADGVYLTNSLKGIVPVALPDQNIKTEKPPEKLNRIHRED